MPIIYRLLVAAAEVEGQAGWAGALGVLLNEANDNAHRVQDAGDEAVDPEVLAGLLFTYMESIGAGWAANPTHPPGSRSTKGARPKQVNCAPGGGAYATEILRFVTDL